MKAVFSGAQMGHAPTRFLSLGNMVAYPEAPERARRLLAGARAAGLQVFGAKQFDPEALYAIHGRAYVKFLREGFEEFAKLPGAGPELIASLKLARKATRISSHILGQAGRYTMDFSCPLTAGTWKSVAASAMTALTAADLVLKGADASYALCRPPGHHAYATAAGGFCYINNTALAAQSLRQTHEKVAILDIDLHHGNGTQAIFYARADVLTVSIHADPDQFYPFYWGYPQETGEAEGADFNLNIPLPPKSGDGAWFAALDQAIERITAFAPGALVVALGLDAHEADPLAGGAVTTSGFERMGERIGKIGLPTVIVQEGGYLTEHLGDNLAMFLVGFQGSRENDVDAAQSPDAV